MIPVNETQAPVRAWCEQAPVLPSLCGLHMLLYARHLDRGAAQGPASRGHDPPHPGLRGLQVGEERLPVVLPLPRQLRGGRVLAAAQLQRDLHAVGEVVVEVLHAALQHVPLRPVGDAAREVVSFAGRAGGHGAVLGGVQPGQPRQQRVVRGRGLENIRRLLLDYHWL